MPAYEYRCDTCQSPTTINTSIANYEATFANKALVCDACDGSGLLLRVYRPFRFKLPMPDHYNPSAGQYVSGEKHLKDIFKQKSDEATERTGIPHSFAPVDLRDTEALGVTREGLEEDAARRHDAGLPVPPLPK